MKEIDDGFTIPSWLLEDIVEYIDSGRSDCKWKNLYTLIRTAENNGRFTKLQADYIIDTIKS